jgi:hypothetical protein
MAFSSSNSLRLAATQTSALDLGGASASHGWTQDFSFDEGTGLNQANRVWSDTRTLGASATEDLDLVGASLLDAFGVAVTFARIKLFAVRAALGNTNNVVIGGDAAGFVGFLTPAASGLVTLRPGMSIIVADPSATGMVVTATTADILQVANSAGGTSVSYDVYLVGSAS